MTEIERDILNLERVDEEKISVSSGKNSMVYLHHVQPVIMIMERVQINYVLNVALVGQ